MADLDRTNDTAKSTDASLYFASAIHGSDFAQFVMALLMQ